MSEWAETRIISNFISKTLTKRLHNLENELKLKVKTIEIFYLKVPWNLYFFSLNALNPDIKHFQ